jgi:SAM-dependent methyltransferase
MWTVYAVSTLALASPPYWADPRIHQLGNGALHAALARPATHLINAVAYGGRDVRAEVLAAHVHPSDVVVDLCCGTGASTARVPTQAAAAVGVDTSDAMIREARWRRGPTGDFVVGNAETWWPAAGSVDVVTLFFALHEMPPVARATILDRATRMARRHVVVCDISPNKVPSNAMLAGEPYLRNYQLNILDELWRAAPHARDRGVRIDEWIPGRVLCAVLPGGRDDDASA